ncbi:hypothetical protein [Pseudarthrobacter phenanthrenivorans]|uniref:Uncharacterized protein n=1 Tax=Pseudarthrobacter phenanthrenivorans TaxID=361575 RepID=A0A0B4DW50_PSEPS|nr:hypothetical protein [Pseudarthrobacter phenanthrenivorans]KIC68680.1 hypothetical protein RM50_04230 [Pseudarthrobacter phenanthrenivorans]
MDRLAKIEALRDSTAPVGGLVDTAGAAKLLGLRSVPPNEAQDSEDGEPDYRLLGKRLSTWLAKLLGVLRAGKSPTGILAAMPDPVGYLHGGPVWRVSDIEKMRPAVEASAGSVGRPRKNPPPAESAA